MSKPARIVGWFGRALLTVGVLVLAFVAFQLWGTGVHETKAQDSLSTAFDQMLADAKPTPKPSGPQTTLPPTVAASTQIATEIGQPIGRLQIPKLNVDKIVVQGVPLAQLDRAPGHYPQTPFPGQAGNASIAGHRTTYGAPFYNIDKLKPGDLIHIQTVQGNFTYSVIWSKIVKPDAMWVLDTDPDHPNTLTLTACHPRLDLTERYIVRAVLQGRPAPTSPRQTEAMHRYARTASTLADGSTNASHPEAWPQFIIWALVCAAIWLAAWWLSRRWRRNEGRVPPRWVRAAVPYVVGLPLFGGALFFAFVNLANIVPAGL